MKRILLILLGIVIGVSIVGNIRTQYGTLKEALEQNQKTKLEVDKIRQENLILKQKIEYATGSAFLEEEVRDKLALGRENDVWLKLKPEEDLDLFPKAKEVQEVPKIRQWIDLFTQ